MRHPTHPRQAGVGLIEVLVAVTILSFGMLGIAALQATALRNSQSSLERSQAVMQTYTILDAMRANRDVAMIGGYDMGNINGDKVTSWACDPPAAGDLAANDRRAWMGAADQPGTLKATLSNACAAIRCTDSTCQVALRWDDSRGTGGDDPQEMMTWTRL